MSDRSGFIYEMEGNRYGLAIHKEQNVSFQAIEKILVHVFTDRLCTKPELDAAGKPKVILKHFSKLKQIGFSD